MNNLRGIEVKKVPGPCLWCGQWVESMTGTAGPSNPNDPCWASALYPDGPFGDFGCDESPETCERGVGSHARSYDLAKLLLEAPTLVGKITEAIQSVFRKY